jgi:beta-N-acetylhexosaminidase
MWTLQRFSPAKHRILPCAFVFIWLACLLAAAPLAAQADEPSRLTLEQRVAQMFVVNLYGAQLNQADKDFLTHYQPGGVVLLGDNIGNPEAVTRLTNSYQQAVTGAGGLPLLIAVDQETGPISHLKDGFTVFPTPSLITATGDSQLAERVGQAVGQELHAVGINMDLAPIADLETNPQNPIIVRRSFGSDPAMVSPMIDAFVSGLQGAGIVATVKHFPGHGDSSSDSHTSLPVIDLSHDRLESVELAPFRAAIGAQVSAVMVAHIWYPALEPQQDLPASLSPHVVTGLLRGELGYNGLVMTDALDMDAIDTTYSYPDAVVKAIQAGVDLVIAAHISPDTQAQAIDAVVSAVQSGSIPEARINESVQRILDAKQQYHVLDWQALDPSAAAAHIDLQAHSALIDELFRAGITLVYDQNQAVPLAPDRRIGIVYPATRTQIAQECGAYRSDIQWLGVSDSPSAEEISWAQDAARRVDTLVVFTQNADVNKAQQELVNALPAEKTLVVALWSPYDILSFPHVSAYMVTYSPARPAVPAACAILFGAAPARGHLSITLGDTMPAGQGTDG